MKRSFFQTRTLAEIKALYPKYIADNFVEEILSNEPLIIPDLISEKFLTPQQFQKHDPDIKLKRFDSLEEILEYGKLPSQLREEAFNPIKSPFFAVYSIRPLAGIDRIIREISPVDCVDGADLYRYMVNHADRKPIPYDDTSKIQTEGAKVWVSVPSRRKKIKRYEFEWQSIPIINNNNKHRIALTIKTVGHGCGDKIFNKELKYSRANDTDSSKRITFCAHEIAAYLRIIDYYKNLKNTKKSLIPLQMCQFAIPSKLTVKYNYNIKNNLLIRTENGELKKPDIANRIILNNMLVQKYKYHKTFYSSKKRDGDLRDYKF